MKTKGGKRPGSGRPAGPKQTYRTYKINNDLLEWMESFVENKNAFINGLIAAKKAIEEFKITTNTNFNHEKYNLADGVSIKDLSSEELVKLNTVDGNKKHELINVSPSFFVTQSLLKNENPTKVETLNESEIDVFYVCKIDGVEMKVPFKNLEKPENNG